MVATIRSSAGSPNSDSQLSACEMKIRQFTFLRLRDKPGQGSHPHRYLYDTFKGNTTAQVKTESLSNRQDQKVIQRVVGRVHQQRVVQQRHD